MSYMLLNRSEVSILLIDDDLDFKKKVTDYLDDTGFRVLDANDGEEGLSLIRKEIPDAVVANLHAKKISGKELLNILNREFPNIPTVIVSSGNGLNDVIQALRNGAWDYMQKPIEDPAVIEHSVCKALERSRLIEENKIYREKLEQINEQLKKNLETLKQDQEAGRSVQMKLLPKSDIKMHNILMSHRVLPSLYLSGDFIDYFLADDDTAVVYIADVSGHGASSAFITVLLRTIVHQELQHYKSGVSDIILHPEKILERISGEIYGASLGKYLTMVYGVIDLPTNQMTYAIGGHFPNPILVTTDNKVSYLEGKGFPVGIMKKVDYKLYSVSIENMSSIMMCSDGILEVLPVEDLPQKEQYLLDIVRDAKGNPDNILKALKLGGDQDEHLPDDITLLMVNKN